MAQIFVRTSQWRFRPGANNGSSPMQNIKHASIHKNEMLACFMFYGNM